MMTALDLKMEITQQIQGMPDSEQMLLRLLNYVKGLTRKHDVDTVLTGDALRMWNRIVELESLKPSWDGAGAAPMEKKVVENMKQLIKAGISSDFKNWVLFPDDNGTMLLQTREGNASISVGSNTYSFVQIDGNDIRTGEKLRFSTSSLLKTIRAIA